MEEYLLPCINKNLFGVECYGCGGQRALLLVFKGEFTEAFLMYPAIYSLLLLLSFLIVNLFVKFKYDYRIKIWLIVLNGTVIGISYILKMSQFLQLTN
ncbi:DUF2752 domain-containing protein [Salegentibacter chungangensis]|uniref:DUF2752 domain-containing protein n=1 Tax=Salegentibacter chungangensis TaxID=1335724 RepID=A0ABW3NT43_9FLAO